MGNRLFLRIRLDQDRQNDVDIEVPGNESIQELMPELLKILYPRRYQLRFENLHCQLKRDGKVLPENKTLIELGVQNSDILSISFAESTETKQTEEESGVVEKTIPLSAVATRKQKIPQADKYSYKHIPIEQPSLVSLSPPGWLFVLGMPPITIGRPDIDFKPDIDLTDLDKHFLSSRRHAEIILKKDRFYLVAKETTNGTYLDGAKLTPGEPKQLKNNAKIQFGVRGVKMVFCKPTHPQQT